MNGGAGEAGGGVGVARGDEVPDVAGGEAGGESDGRAGVEVDGADDDPDEPDEDPDDDDVVDITEESADGSAEPSDWSSEQPVVITTVTSVAARTQVRVGGRWRIGRSLPRPRPPAPTEDFVNGTEDAVDG